MSRHIPDLFGVAVIYKSKKWPRPWPHKMRSRVEHQREFRVHRPFRARWSDDYKNNEPCVWSLNSPRARDEWMRELAKEFC